MYNNPGKTMTIYDIASMVGIAFPKAMTPSNMQAGFRVSGIRPVNVNIFTEQIDHYRKRMELRVGKFNEFVELSN